MIPGYQTKNFITEEQQVIFHKKCDNGVQFFVKTVFENTDFLGNQQEIMNDFIGAVLSRANVDERLPEEEVKTLFEQELQQLNKELELFASKIESENFFGIRGVVWIVYQGLLMASMIGEVSLMIVRDDKIHYKVYNDKISGDYISIFSDFVEGELELDDKIVVLGTNYQQVLHTHDLKECNEVLASTEVDLLDFLEQLLLSKIEKEQLGFIVLYDYHQATDVVNFAQKEKIRRKKNSHVYKQIQHFLFKNKYSMTVVVLGIVVLLLGYNIINDMFATQADIPQITTQSGTKVITIESIRKDIDYFTNLDPTSYEKARVYKDIVSQLSFLEERGKRLEDVNKLKTVVQNKYYEGFNVVYMNNLNNSDISLLYGFNSSEQSTLAGVNTLLYNESFDVGGQKGALIGAINKDIRGTLVNYNIEDSVKGCSFDLSRNGLYCFTDTNTLIRVVKGGVSEVKIEKEEGEDGKTSLQSTFDTPIVDIDVFNKNSLYVLHQNIEDNKQGKYITKYINVLGNFDVFKKGLPYILAGYNTTGKNMLQLQNFVIDGSFLVWDAVTKSVYQLWRNNSINMVEYRPVTMEGGDTIEDKYSETTKILTNIDSKYVYLFDKVNQTFTVYLSSPLKTNERFANSYNLLYVCRFKFDFQANKVVDVAISNKNANNPYLYFLTKDGIYQIALGEFITQYSK